MQTSKNPTGLKGIAFVEWAGAKPGYFEKLWQDFGFSKLKKHVSKNVTYFRQNDIHFLVNEEKQGFAADFAASHGPCICAMGFRVENAFQAFEAAVAAGAKPYEGAAHSQTVNQPAVYGIGDSLIYFVDRWEGEDGLFENQFKDLEQPVLIGEKGFLTIDHLTNNVFKGTMSHWANFYKKVFGFTEVRTFDIKGKHTGLFSYALQSPCKSFCIPINEGNEDKSQIEEYLQEYNGAGIQHLAFLSHDLLASLDLLEDTEIETLDIGEGYYKEAFARVPGIREDKKHIMRHEVLVDGDEEGYLLQIFTKNLVGPIFIELIQRNNHYSFGEGNFQSLFDSIERDQERRGVFA